MASDHLSDTTPREETKIRSTFVYSQSKREKLLLVMTQNYFTWIAAEKFLNYNRPSSSISPGMCCQLENNSSKRVVNSEVSLIDSKYGGSGDHVHINTPLKCDSFLKFADVVGLDLSKANSNDNQGCFLKIYAYPKLKKRMNKTETRRKKVFTFYFHNKRDFHENFEEVNDWIAAYNELSLNTAQSKPQHKKLLILVNPFGGSGKAMHLYKKKVVPILIEADMRYETIATEYAGHAKNLIKKMDLPNWSGVVVISGDGLIHEVINGMMEREDWMDAMKIPIGVIPGGSGNALICSVLYQAGESYLHNIILTSTLFVIKNRCEPMDLVAVETHTGRRLYSFLSVAWGIVADVDIESEKYRHLGKARFMVGALKRIMNLRKYKGTLSFLPLGDNIGPATKIMTNNLATTTNLAMTTTSIATTSIATTSTATTSIATTSTATTSTATTSTATTSTTTTATSNQVVDSNTPSPPQQQQQCGDSLLTNDSIHQSTTPLAPTSTTTTSTMTINNTRFSTTVQTTTETVENNQPLDLTQPDPHPHLDNKIKNTRRPNYAPNSLNDPVPENWTKISADDFVSVIAVYQTHLAQDMKCTPSSRLHDGCIYLGVIMGNVSKRKMLHYFNAMENGAMETISDPYCRVHRVKAFRIEPSCDVTKGFMTVDGERVEYGPIQGWVMEGLGRVMKPW